MNRGWTSYGLALGAGLATALAREAPPPQDRPAVWALLSLAAMIAAGAIGGVWPTLACAVVALGCGLALLQVSIPVALSMAGLAAAIALLAEGARRLRRRASAAAAYLREREVHLQSILDTAPDGLVVFDARGVIGAFSNAAEKQFGWSAAEAIGADVGQVLPHALTAALEDGAATRATTGVRRDGSSFPLELSLAVSGLGERRFFTAFVRDLTLDETAPSLSHVWPGSERDAITERLCQLSTRERQVLHGLVAGQANKTIAYDLSISPRTVEIYRAKLMAKMEAKSLPELVRMALVGEA